MKLAGRIGALVALGGAAAQRVYAQGCALCYTSASALDARGIRALDQGIVILLVPPLVFFIGVFVFFYRRRNAFRFGR